MIVQACLNGTRPAGFHPNLPVPDAIIADGVASIAAGAHELHVHVRNGDGVETLAPGAVNSVVGGLRARSGGTFMGVSRVPGSRRTMRTACRLIDCWGELPDYASVNLGEVDAPAVFQRLARRGVAVEAGLANSGDAERFTELGLARQSLRILIELDDGEAGEAECHARADKILGAVLAEAFASRSCCMAREEACGPLLSGCPRRPFRRASGSRTATRCRTDEGRSRTRNLPRRRATSWIGGARESDRQPGDR